MMDSLLKRIEKNRKAHTRWLAMVLCLSMIVSLGTFAGFHKTAVAKTYTKEVLDCPYAQEGASPVAHVHNDDCYDGDTLVCTLPEREAHTHTEACFAEQRRLTCFLEENPGHQHGDACYAAREEITCGLEENPGHVHNGTCFNDSGVLICTMAEGDGAHTHTADCFTTVYDLICDIPEGEGAHTHTDECYTTERVQVCGQEELPVHVHGPECIRTVEWTEGEEEPVVTDEPVESTVPEMPVSDPDADLESVEDWNREFENLELSGNWARDLILVAATQQGRGESPNNFEAFLNDAGDAWVRYGYTRYGAWYGVPYANEWSAMFVSFCLRYAGIPAENVPNNPTAAFMAESFQKGELFAGRDYVPAVGDLIFFDTVDDEITTIDHMGIVYHVDAENGTINTVEGDRTDAVATFGYYLDDEQIAGYGILPQNPNYIPAEEENTEDELDGLIVMTEDEEQPEETTDTEEAAAPAADMPAQSWERTAGGIKVSVEAPEGAFPENTTIAVTPVNGNRLKDTVSDAVSGEILEVQAVDITFFDAEGNEIEPAIPIRVTMTPAATQHAEEKTSVVHVDIAEQTAELIEQAAGTEFDNSEVVFDADAFTIYAIVYTYQVEYEYEVDGKTFTSSMPGAENMTLTQIVEGLGIVDEAEIDTFVSKIESIASSNEEVAIVTENSEIRVLKDGEAKIVITMQDGAKFHIDVRAEGETSASNETATVSTKGDLYLPADAELKTEVLDEVKSESAIAAVEAQEGTANSNAAAAETAYQVFDISLENVEADQYDGFQVEVKLPEGVVGKNFHLYHVHDGKVDELKLDNVDSDGETVLLESVSFVTPSFSEFVLSYTVDFEYEVDGKVYSFSMPGTTSMPVSELLINLGVTDAEHVDGFVRMIERIAFTSPNLLIATKITEDTTIEEVEKQVFYIVFEDAEAYAEEITGEEEAVENARLASVVTAPDWVLTSTAPFNTDEVLTVTMVNGEQFHINVTDALYAGLNEFITDATVVIDGHTYGKNDTWGVYPDTDYTMTLSFSEKGMRQFPEGGNTVMMKIPEGLTLQEGATGTFDIPAGLAGTLRGNTYVVRNGYLYITFARDPRDILTRSSNVHFDLTLTAQFEEGYNEIRFNDRVNPDIDVNTSGDITLDKTGTYNAATGKMDYTVTVKSTGTTKNINVKDVISGTTLEYDNSSLSVTSSTGQAVNYTSNTTPSGTNGYDITIPEMKNDEVVTIKYSADIKNWATLKEQGYKFTAGDKNTVEAKPENGDKKQKEFTYNNEINYSNITKTSGGSSAGEDSDHTVMSWTIKANENPVSDIAGGKITDKIGWNSKEAMTYQVVSHVPTNSAQGTEAVDCVELKVKVTGEENREDTVYVPVVTDQNGQQSWEYIILSTDKKNSYEITYNTVVDKSKLPSYANGVVTNDSTNDHGGSSTGTGVVGPNGTTPGDNTTVGKSAATVTEEYIDWTIVVNIPKGTNYTDDFFITDNLPWHYPDNGAGVTGAMADTFMKIPTSEGGDPEYGIKVVGLNGDEHYTVTVEDKDDMYLRDENGNPVTRQVATIQFYWSSDNTNKGLNKDEDKDRTITVTLRTKNSEYWLNAGTKSNELTRHTNNVTVMGHNASGTGQPMLSSVSKSGREATKPQWVTDETGDYVYFYYDITLSNVTSLPVTVTDTFSSDLSFVEWGEGLVDRTTGVVNDLYGQHQDVYIVGGDNSYENRQTGTDNTNKYMPTYQESGNTVTFTVNGLFTKEDGSYYPYYHIRYYLKATKSTLVAKALQNNGKTTLGNTVEWGDHTHTTEIDYTVPVMTKEGWFRDSIENDANNRMYDFLIDVNPDGYQLNGGNTLEIVDSHSSNLSIDYTTVRAYKIPDDATNVTKATVREVLRILAKSEDERYDWEQSTVNNFYAACGNITDISALSDPNVGWNFSGNDGTFSRLQDETHYVIVYSALIVGSGSQSFSNEAELNGYYATKRDSRWFDSNASGGADVYQIKLLKHIYGDNSKGLGGAVFQLFMDDGNGNKVPMTYGDTIYTRGQATYTDSSDGTTFNTNGQNVVGQYITFTTDDTGNVNIKLNQTVHGAELEEGVHYYLKEIASPPGFKIDSSVEYWSFTLTKDPDEVNYGDTNRRDENGNRQWIYFYYDDILKMANSEIKEEDIDLSVEKKWYGEDGTELTIANNAEALKQLIATVRVYRREDKEENGTMTKGEFKPVKIANDGTTLTVTEVTENNEGIVTLRYSSSADDLKKTWEKLPRMRVDGNTKYYYTYEIREEHAEKENDPNYQYTTTLTSTESEKDGKTTIAFTVRNFDVKETKTNIQIQKEWKDSAGNAITYDSESGTWKDSAGETLTIPENIKFRLYRVVSKSPFVNKPNAGGSPLVLTKSGGNWVDDAGNVVATAENTAWASAVTVVEETDASGNTIDVYQLSKAGYNGVTFEGLPASVVKTLDNGSTDVTYYAYYIKEMDVEDFDTTSSVSTATSGDTTTTTTTLTNKKRPEESKTSLKIQKEWRRDDGTENGVAIAAPVNTVVTYQIYRYTSDRPIPDATKIDSSGEPYDIKNGWGGYDWNWHHITNLEGQPAEDGLYQLGVNNDWSVVDFTNLPEVEIVNGKAQYYAYYVEEVDLAENVTAKYTITKTTTDGVNAYTVKMTNTVHPEETFVEVEKKWTVDGQPANFAADGETAKNWPDDIRIVVKLFRDGEAYPNAENQLTVTLTSTNQKDTFTGLPKDDGNRNNYVYTVTETIQKKNGDTWEDVTTVAHNGTDLAVASTITGEAGGYLLTNNLTTPGTLKVTKTIGGSKSGQVAPSKISFTVTGPNGTVATFTYAEMTGDSHPKVKELTGLAPGTYTVTEQDQNTGLSRTTTYTVTPAGTSEAGTSTTGSSASAEVEKDKTTVVAFNNTYEESNGMQLTIQKQWEPNPGDNAQATFKIHQLASSGSGTAAQTYDTTTNRMTLSANAGDTLLISGKSKDPYGNSNVVINNDYINVQGGDDRVISKAITIENKHVVNGQVTITFQSTDFLEGNPTIQVVAGAVETGWTKTVTLTGSQREITVNDLPESDGTTTYSYWVEEVSCIPNTYSGTYTSTVGQKTSPISASSENKTVRFNNTSSTPGTTEFTVKKAWEGADESTLQDKIVVFELMGVRKSSEDGIIRVSNNKSNTVLNVNEDDTITACYRVSGFGIETAAANNFIQRLGSEDGYRIYTQYYYHNSATDLAGQNWTNQYYSVIEKAEITDSNEVLVYVKFNVGDGFRTYYSSAIIDRVNIDFKFDGVLINDISNESAAEVQINWGNFQNQIAVEGIADNSNFRVESFGEFTLTSTDNWSKHFSGLSDKYYYYAVEKSVDGSTVLETYSPQYAITAPLETVTNTVPGPKTVTVSALKQWVDNPSESGIQTVYTYHPTVTFTLYRKALAKDETAPTEAQKLEIAKAIAEGKLTGVAAGYGIAVENTAGFNPKRTVSGTEAVSWENLSAEDANGNKYVYVVVENNVPHYELTSVTGDGIEAPYELTNTLKPEKLDLTIQKQWKEFGADVTSESKFDSAYINYKVMKLTYTDEARTQLKADTTATEISTGTLSKTSTITVANEDGTSTTLPWAAAVSNLPKMSITDIKSDGTFEAEYYKYYVEETAYSPDGTTEVTNFSESASYTVSYQVDGGMVLNAATQEYFDMTKDEASLTISNSNNEMTLDILKTDLNGKPISGAKFKLEKYNTTENKYQNVTVTPTGNATKQYYTYSSAGADTATEMEVGDDGKLHIEKLPVGIYRLTETEAPQNYVASSDEPFVFQIEGGTISPVPHKTITYKNNIVNVPNTPEAELVIKKTISGPEGITDEQKQALLGKITFVIDDVTEDIADKDKTPGFTKTFEMLETATTGMTLSTSDGILYGHTYRVTEVVQDNDGTYKFKQVSYVKNGEAASAPVKTTSTPVDGIALTDTSTIPVKGEVDFTNEYEGRIDLSLTKKLENAPAADADKKFQFTVKLTDLTENAEDRNIYQTVITATDGTTKSGSSVIQEKGATEATATVTLGQNETWTVKDLPSGASYTITETSYTADGYVPLVTSGAMNGTLAANSGTTAVEVTNIYSETIVTKIWNDMTANKVEWPTEVESITLNLTRKKGETQDMSFGTNGSVAITVTKQSDGFTVSGNPNGTTASVVLKDTSDPKQGYTLVIRGLEKKYLDGTEVKSYTYEFSENAVTDYTPMYGIENGNSIVNATAAPEGGTITNRQAGGYELPQTGGIGTTLFTALGGLMTATAGAILTMKSYRRRKQNA